MRLMWTKSVDSNLSLFINLSSQAEEKEVAAHGEPNDSRIDSKSTGPVARPFTRSLALLTHWLAPHCSLRSRAPLRSFVRSLARSLTHSRARGKEMFFYEMNASISYRFNPSCGVGVGGGDFQRQWRQRKWHR